MFTGERLRPLLVYSLTVQVQIDLRRYWASSQAGNTTAVRSFDIGVGNAEAVNFSPERNLYLSNPASRKVTRSTRFLDIYA